jgi:hypothetical protein
MEQYIATPHCTIYILKRPCYWGSIRIAEFANLRGTIITQHFTDINDTQWLDATLTRVRSRLQNYIFELS